MKYSIDRFDADLVCWKSVATATDKICSILKLDDIFFNSFDTNYRVRILSGKDKGKVIAQRLLGVGYED